MAGEAFDLKSSPVRVMADMYNFSVTVVACIVAIVVVVLHFVLLSLLYSVIYVFRL